MGLLDGLTKTITQGVDRGKFELDKFQKTSRIQGELNDLKKQIDDKLRELGQRAYELHRAGQFNTPSVTALVQGMEQLQSGIVLKEEELKAAQVEVFVESPHTTTTQAPAAQNVPISHEEPVRSAPSTPWTPPVVTPTPVASAKTCPNCGFQMPVTAMFCPSCGTRVGAV